MISDSVDLRDNSFVSIFSQIDFFTDLNGWFLVNEDLTVRVGLLIHLLYLYAKTVRLTDNAEM